MEQHWLVRPATIRKLWLGFILILAATLAAELFVSHDAHFGIEASFAFHAWYGFLSCAALIGVARLLGLILKRRDSYYEERE
ncbi:MAG TPA: hypothetical protein VED01_24375 [Burkholderiales bacterium]|nr:hypothetical protein [Burkholderiales bacterium]